MSATMEFDIYRIFPLEIWENIITFCDGSTLKELQRIDSSLPDIVESVNRRRSIWQKNCLLEIPKYEFIDICRMYCPEDPHKWKSIYDTWDKWKNILQYDFIKTTITKDYISISDIKVSGEMVVIADKIGFTILDSSTGKSKRYKIGAIQKIELFNRPRIKSYHKKKTKKFLHNTLDCTVEANFHLFYDLHRIDRVAHLRQDKFEKKIIRYPSNGKVLQLRYPFIDGDELEDTVSFLAFYNSLIESSANFTLIVKPSCICYTKKNSEEYNTNFEWKGVRCWLIWHAQLLICAKDETFHLYINKRMKTLSYGQYPRVTAIFYFNGILFLGLVQGTLLLYRIIADDILQFDFENYDKKIQVSQYPIGAINIVETEEFTNIILASENEIYQLHLNNISL